MYINRKSIEQAVQVLNEALEADPIALRNLLTIGVPVNDTLTAHPSIQVVATMGGATMLRPLGLINGLFGADDESYGFIQMEIDTESHDPFCANIVRFRVDEERLWAAESGGWS